MADRPNPHANFEVSLGELERCAHESMQRMTDAMGEVLARWPRDQPVLASSDAQVAMTMTVPLLGTLAALCGEQRKARDATEATRAALVDIADTYRRADRFPGGSRGR